MANFCYKKVASIITFIAKAGMFEGLGYIILIVVFSFAYNSVKFFEFETKTVYTDDNDTSTRYKA